MIIYVFILQSSITFVTSPQLAAAIHTTVYLLTRQVACMDHNIHRHTAS